MDEAKKLLRRFDEAHLDEISWCLNNLVHYLPLNEAPDMRMRPSISRIKQYVDSKTPFAMITAWRSNWDDEADKVHLSEQENERRNVDLGQDLYGLNLVGIPMLGYYRKKVEGVPNELKFERSFFVPYLGQDIGKFYADISRLGDKWNQDSVGISDGKIVGFIEKGGIFKKYGTAVSFSSSDIGIYWSEAQGVKFAFVESAVIPDNEVLSNKLFESGIVSDVGVEEVRELCPQLRRGIRYA